MKILKFLVVGLFSAALAACGGGSSGTLSGPGGNGGGTGGGSTATTILVTSSTQQIASDGSTTATITAVVRDANQNFVSGATVTFSANAGGLSVANSGKTDTSGAATATLSASGAAAGTTITVTAATGTITGTTTVNVVAQQQTLTMSTNSAQIPSDASKTATLTAVLKDANNAVVSGATIAFSASSGNLIVTQAVTDANGKATATVDAGADPTNRQIDVTATATSGSTVTVPVFVTGTSLALTGSANLVQGTQATYNVLLTDSASRGIAGKTVTLASASGNTLSATSVVTDFNGQASFKVTGAVAGNDTLTGQALGLVAQQPVAVSAQNFTITAPAANTNIDLNTPTTVTVTWLNGGTPVNGSQVTFSTTRGTLSASTATTNASGVASVTVQANTAGPGVITASGSGVTAQVAVNFVATTPSQISLQASPSSIPTQGQSVLTAVVRDAQNNLVAGQPVTFTLTDPTGGQLSTGSATTDSQGRAQTTYTASTTTSATNGVKVDATVTGTAVTTSATLTVSGQTVFLSLGTGNSITALNAAQYQIDYAVQALDAQGAALPNASVTLNIVSLEYVKGDRQWSGSTWATVPSTNPGTCPSEDINFNGILDPGEDANNNKILDPGNVASVSPASGQTDANGTLITHVTYPKDHAYYVKVKLTATAVVQGTQSSTSTTFLLPGLAADFNSLTVAPPGPTSPYGTASTCGDPN
jgi:hypothetical protein